MVTGAVLLALASGFSVVATGEPGGRASYTLIGLLAGLLGLLMVVKHPEAGLLLLLVLLYTNASEVLVRRFDLPSPLQLLALALLGVTAARWFSSNRSKRRTPILDPVLLTPLLMYAAVVFASSLVAADVALADQRLLELFKGILIFLLVTNLATTPAALRRVVWALIMAGAILGTISVFQVLTGAYGQEFGGFGRVKIAHIVGESREPRIAGPLSDPNFYAQILVALVPLALYRLWDEAALTRKLTAGYALAVITLAAVFTFSRGGAVALGMVFVAALIHRKVRMTYLLMGLVALAPISLFVPESFAGRLITLQQVAPGVEGAGEREDSSFRQRRLLMAVAWEMFEDHPLLGVGAGNYTERFHDYAGRIGSTQRSYDEYGDPHYPHSIYLEVVAESGLLGLLTFLSILAAAFYSLLRGYRDFRRADSSHMADIAVSIGLALAAYSVTSVLLHADYVQYLWLLVAMAAAVRRVALRTRAGEAQA